MTWYRFDDPPVFDGGGIGTLAPVVIADTMPGVVGHRVGTRERMWFAPSVRLAVHILDEWRSPWVLRHDRAHQASKGFASPDMALWDCGEGGRDDDPRPVAYATQVCLFTFAGDRPEPAQAGKP